MELPEVDITTILSPYGRKLGEIVKVESPEGWQIFWKTGQRSRVFHSWVMAQNAAEIYFPFCAFVRLNISAPLGVDPAKPENDDQGE